MANEYLFVYGTLLKSIDSPQHRKLIQNAEFSSFATLQGLMFNLGDYPGVIESDTEGDQVIGELYRIKNREVLFSFLDDYEECSEHHVKPHEYVRKLCRVLTSKSIVLTAWVYIYNRDVTQLELIPSGDYYAFANKK
ncbi:gamma-glutamylcyclotransferase family protein [Glaciecola sp. 1036]|uniref:gamma-glutamylcyclotransferase family protein n=1 Tax=Alteromonadaceae TaxID=72275 RepID=UPI003D073150